MRVVINLPDHEFTEHLIYARAKGFVGQSNNEAVKTLLTFCAKQHIKKYPLGEAQRREIEKNYGLRVENPVASSVEQLGDDTDE